MHRYLISAIFLGTACGTSGLKVDVSEGDVPTDDTSSIDTSDDDRDDEDDEDRDDEDDEDRDDEDDDDRDDEDEDEDDEDKGGEFTGTFSFGPLGIPPFCEGEMSGSMDSKGSWSSEGECTISAGPGTGVELDFYVEGSFSGTDLTGTTYMVEGNQKVDFDTEGFYSEPREAITLEWGGDLTTPQGDTMEAAGEAILYLE
jgi:hypothetical protein